MDLVSVWVDQAQLLLGQHLVEDQSNDITALPELLGTLVLDGCIATVNAMSY